MGEKQLYLTVWDFFFFFGLSFFLSFFFLKEHLFHRDWKAVSSFSPANNASQLQVMGKLSLDHFVCQSSRLIFPLERDKKMLTVLDYHIY